MSSSSFAPVPEDVSSSRQQQPQHADDKEESQDKFLIGGCYGGYGYPMYGRCGYGGLYGGGMYGGGLSCYGGGMGYGMGYGYGLGLGSCWGGYGGLYGGCYPSYGGMYGGGCWF